MGAPGKRIQFRPPIGWRPPVIYVLSRRPHSMDYLAVMDTSSSPSLVAFLVDPLAPRPDSPRNLGLLYAYGDVRPYISSYEKNASR